MKDKNKKDNEIRILKARIKELEKSEARVKQAEEALRKEIDKAQNYLDIAGSIILTLDIDGKITRMNKKGCDIFGYSKEEVIGKDWFLTFLPERMREEVKAIFNRIINGEIKELQAVDGFSAITKSGKEISLFWHSSIITDENNNIIGILSAGEDITEQKQLEKESSIRNQINTIFLTHPDEKMYAEVLKIVLETMESEFGTFGYFDKDGAFVAPAVSRKIYWEKCNIPEKDIIFQKGTFSGIWARAIKKRKTLISNDGSFNTPEGHIPIKNTMVTPIVFKGEVISVIHLANKANGYDEEDRRMLEIIADQIAPVLYARVQRDFLKKERDKSEEELYYQQKQLESIFKAAPIGIGVVINRNIKFVNKKFVEIIGYSVKELIGQNVRMVYVNDEEYERVGKEKYEQIRETGTGVIETRFRKKDGNIIDILLSSTPFIPNDLSKGITFTALDITERKRAEKEIRILSKVVETTPEAIIITDMQGKIEYVNQGLLTLGGFEDNNSIIGKSVFTFSNEEGVKQLKEEIIPTILSEGKWIGEVSVKRKDDSIFLTEMICSSILDEKGKPKYLLSQYQDITMRKKAEETLKKKMNELEIFNDASVDRELIINELRKEINELLNKSGKEPKYEVVK